jgi:hypothetical protein
MCAWLCGPKNGGTSPVAGFIRLRKVAAANCRPGPKPPIELALRNWAIANAVATVDASLITTVCGATCAAPSTLARRTDGIGAPSAKT